MTDRGGLREAIRLCTALNDGSPQKIPSDRESIKAMLRQLGENGVVLLAYGDDPHVALGVVGGLAYPSWVNRSVKIAQEMFWFVDPEHRHGGVGRALLEAFHVEAERLGCDQIVMVSMGDKRADASLKAGGYLGAETNYFYTICKKG
jgi:GNAT superfamily N-acetyltransferase